MIKVRIGDVAMGICFWPPPPAGPGPLPSVGIISTGNPMDLSGGFPTAGIADIAIFPCGPALIMMPIPMDISLMPRATLGASVVGPICQSVVVTGNPMDISI